MNFCCHFHGKLVHICNAFYHIKVEESVCDEKPHSPASLWNSSCFTAHLPIPLFVNFLLSEPAALRSVRLLVQLIAIDNYHSLITKSHSAFTMLDYGSAV